jgi:hypothetical protein
MRQLRVHRPAQRRADQMPSLRERVLAHARVPRARPGLVRYRGIGVSPRLAGYLRELDRFAVTHGGSIVWTSGYRSPQEQAVLHARYLSGDPSVPFEPLPYALSKHGTGDAADGETRPSSMARLLGAYARSIGMGWSAREPWHFEVT